MKSESLSFHHPLAFWLGCAAIIAGVLAHVPMFIHAAPMGYQMVGMGMSTTMWLGMAMIPLGIVLSGYGLFPRRTAAAPLANAGELHFHVADNISLNREHLKLVVVLFVAVAVDVMKPATLGFVMPGMTREYGIGAQTAGTLALVALTGTALGSILWGVMADIFGRRAAILLSALMFIGTAICGAMPAFTWNLVMCFLMGLSAGGLLPITFALMAESVPSAHRGWLLVALGGFGTIAGYILAAGSAALLEPLFSWRILWLLGLPTGLLVIVLNRYIPESPRYLASKGFTAAAQQVLARFCGDRQGATQNVVAEATPPTETRFVELLRKPYAGISFGLVSAGLAWGLVNFGFLLWLPTNLHSLGLAEQANSLIAQSAVIALPCIALAIWLYHRWSSIYTLASFIAATALSLLFFALFIWLGWHSPWAVSGVTALLLVSASGVVAMLLPYAAEIYPVHLRGTGAGLVAASTKSGGILGAVLGVAGLLDSLTVSAIIIALPLMMATALLLHYGIDTRGRRLEDIHAALTEGTV